MSWLAPLVQWGPKFSSKAHMVRDFFESTVAGASNDCLVTKGVQGIQKKVGTNETKNVIYCGR
jgi:hypothetical protein